MNLSDTLILLVESASSQHIARAIKNINLQKQTDISGVLKTVISSLRRLLKDEELSFKTKARIEDDIRRLTSYMVSKKIRIPTELDPVL
jgi:hypothetical protein